MNRTNVQAFAFGIALTTAIFFVYSLFNQTFDASKNIKELEENNYKVLTIGEYETLLTTIDSYEKEKEKEEATNQEKNDKSQENDNKKQNSKTQKNKVDKTVTINITEGMVLETIASELSRLGVIDDQRSFINYFLKNDLDRGIQLGSYEIKSGMSYQEIADLITR